MCLLLLRRGIRIALSLFGLFLNLFGVISVRILGGVAYGPSRLVLDSIGIYGLCTLISGLSDAHVVLGYNWIAHQLDIGTAS